MTRILRIERCRDCTHCVNDKYLEQWRCTHPARPITILARGNLFAPDYVGFSVYTQIGEGCPLPEEPPL